MLIPIQYDEDGEQVFAGTHTPVSKLFEYAAKGKTLTEFLKDYPDVPREFAIMVIDDAIARLSAPISENKPKSSDESEARIFRLV